MTVKNKRVMIPVISLFILCGLTGCERENSADFHTSETFMETTVQADEFPGEVIEDVSFVSADSCEQVVYYAYETLGESEKEIYQEILQALSTQSEYIDVSTLDTEQLNLIFQYVMDDHPELFYVDGYQYKKYSLDGVVTKLQFYGNYTMSQEEVASCREAIEGQVQKIYSKIPSSYDQYEIAKYLYDWIIEHTDYELQAQNNQNICSVLITNKSVCQGYAKTYQYLLQRLGIEAVLVTGEANQDGHAWNLVKIHDQYYYVDVTWGDASYIYTEDSVIQGMQPINYDYLLVTEEEISKTHTVDGLLKLPETNCVTDNYYVREKLLLDTYDEAVIEQIFQNAYAHNKAYVTIKFATDELYAFSKKKLMDEQRIFQFISQHGNKISYTENEQQKTLSFWI